MSNTINELLNLWIPNSKSREVSILLYLAQVHFNIHRLPSFEDITIQKATKDIVEYLFNNTSLDSKSFKIQDAENNLNKLLDEFKIMYDDTQNRLKLDFPNQDSLTLSRRIIGDVCRREISLPISRYNDYYTLNDLIQLVKKGNDDIEIAMDTLNSWSKSDIASHSTDNCIKKLVKTLFTDYDNYGVIKLTKETPMTDIVYYGEHIETGEFIVLNRSITGAIPFKHSEITFYQNCQNKLNEKIYRFY